MSTEYSSPLSSPCSILDDRITIQSSHRNKIDELTDDKKRIINFNLGSGFCRTIINRNDGRTLKTASNYQAIIINAVAKKNIFEIDNDALQEFNTQHPDFNPVRGRQVVVMPAIDHQVFVEPVHRLRIKELSELARKALVVYFGDAYYKMFYSDLTIPKEAAIATNEITQTIIFRMNEEDDKNTYIPPQVRTKGQKRKLPAPSENPAALSSKKTRTELQTDAIVQQTTTDVNAPYHSQIPLYPSSEISLQIAVSEPPQVVVASQTSDDYSNQGDSNPSQAVTALPTREQINQIRRLIEKPHLEKNRISIVDCRKKIENLDREVLKEVYKSMPGIRDAFQSKKQTTILKLDAFMLNKIAKAEIFKFDKEDVRKFELSFQRFSTPDKGQKRQLPASSEVPAASHSKKHRYSHQIPSYMGQGSIRSPIAIPEEPPQVVEASQTSDNSNQGESNPSQAVILTAVPSTQQVPVEPPPHFNFDETEWYNFNSFNPEGLNSGIAAVVSNNENALLDLDMTDWNNDQQTTTDVSVTTPQEFINLPETTVASDRPFDFNTTDQYQYFNIDDLS